MQSAEPITSPFSKRVIFMIGRNTKVGDEEGGFLSNWHGTSLSLSTTKRGDNALGIVHPSVRLFACQRSHG